MAIFSPLGQTSRHWVWMAKHGSDIYALPQYSNSYTYDVVYKQTNGTGNFEPLTMPASYYQGLAIIGDDLYVTDSAGTLGVLKQTGLTGSFSLHNSDVYFGLTSYGNDLYGILNNNVYKQTNATGAFAMLTSNYVQYRAITVNPANGNVYACVESGDIWMQTAGSGPFVGLGQTSRSWRGLACFGGDVYACVAYGDIYKQTGGVGSFVAMSEGSNNWAGLMATSSRIYATVGGGDIYATPFTASPSILSITPYDNIISGDTLTISGSDLTGGSTTYLYIDDINYTSYITSASSTLITFTAPSLSYGEHSVVVYVGSLLSDPYTITYVAYGTPLIKFSNRDPESRTLIDTTGSVHVTVYNRDNTTEYTSSLIATSDYFTLTSASIGTLDYSSLVLTNSTQVDFDVINISAYGYVTVSASNAEGISSEESDGIWYYSCEDNKLINLTNFLPNHLYESDVYSFTKFFEDFLNTMYVSSDGDCNEGILRKIEKIRDFNDPNLIDIDYVNFFARKVGYNVDVSRGTLGLFTTSGASEYQDLTGSDLEKANKYIRFVLKNLPNWYKIKTTKDAIKIMLFSFGIVGDLVSYFTNDYDQNWLVDDEDPDVNIANVLPYDYYPSPHFSIRVNLRETAPSWFSNIDKVVAAIDSIRPVNTVFQGLDGYYKEDVDTIAITSNIETTIRSYIPIEANLVYWYRFENNGFDSVGNNNGTVVGVYNNTSPFEGSYNLGNIAVLTAPAISLFSSSVAKFSITFRMRSTDFTVGSGNILSTNASGNGIWLDHSGSGYVNTSIGDGLGNNAYQYNYGSTLSPDIWHSYVVTYEYNLLSVNRVKLYIDGIYHPSNSTYLTSNEVSYIAPISYIKIGDVGANGVSELDDFRIYDGILTQNQIDMIASNYL